MKKYGVTKEELENLSVVPNSFNKGYSFFKPSLKVSDKIVRLWEEIALLSDYYYDKFYSHLYMFDSDALFPVTAAAVFYQAILDEVRKNNYNCFTSTKTKSELLRIVLSRVEEVKNNGSNCNKKYDKKGKLN